MSSEENHACLIICLSRGLLQCSTRIEGQPQTKYTSVAARMQWLVELMGHSHNVASGKTQLKEGRTVSQVSLSSPPSSPPPSLVSSSHPSWYCFISFLFIFSSPLFPFIFLFFVSPGHHQIVTCPPLSHHFLHQLVSVFLFVQCFSLASLILLWVKCASFSAILPRVVFTSFVLVFICFVPLCIVKV